jgi:hypothetical protein
MADQQADCHTQEFQALSTDHLSQEYLKLKQIPSSFDTPDTKDVQDSSSGWNADVDSYDGRKHTVMKELLCRLGVYGTNSAEVTAAMGAPNEVIKADSSSVDLMPGPVVPSSTAEPGPEDILLLYYWRGKHDYAWFKVDPLNEVVIAAGWFNALE